MEGFKFSVKINKAGYIKGKNNLINQNKVGNITGNNNVVIQINLNGNQLINETLGALVEPLVKGERKEVERLKLRIAEKEKVVKDKSKIIRLLDTEIIRLKTELLEKQKQLEESEQRFAKIFLENNGRDFSNSKELYVKALQLLAEGEKKEALNILDREKLLKEKQKLEKEKKQQADTWLLRADLLKESGIWNEELNECYDLSVEIYPNWKNNLLAADHFKFINKLQKAEGYYLTCLQKAENDNEKATTLNNLAILQRSKNEINQAERSYNEALEIYRKLAEVNPQIYLPEVAISLNNLANLQSDKNEIKQAERSFREALEICRKLAEVNPQTYLPKVAMTLNNLAILQRSKNEINQAGKSFNEALEIYRKLAKVNLQIYLPDVAITLINLSIFYQESRINKDISLQILNEAILILFPLKDIPFIQKYWSTALKVLVDWGIDVEDYLKKLLTKKKI